MERPRIKILGANHTPPTKPTIPTRHDSERTNSGINEILQELGLAEAVKVEWPTRHTLARAEGASHIRSARASGTRWAGPGCPLLAPEP
jgi:hypothetical protein